MRYSQIVDPILGTDSKTCKHQRLKDEIFERRPWRDVVDKVVTVQHVNQCGESWYHYFHIDGVMYFFHSKKGYWDDKKDVYNVVEHQNLVWIVTKKG